jgi:hypothetical protein
LAHRPKGVDLDEGILFDELATIRTDRRAAPFRRMEKWKRLDA